MPPPESKFDPRHTHALVVGIGAYDAPELPPLDGPVPDALAFSRWLIARGVRPGNIRLFLSRTKKNPAETQPDPEGVPARDATHHNIDDAIRKHLNQKTADPQTMLWIYWGGHGVMQANGSVRLFYRDATATDKRNLDLDALLRHLRTNFYDGIWGRQIVVVDACRTFASYLAWRHGLANEDYGVHLEVKGREQFVLFAARPGEYADEEARLNHATAGLLSRELQARLDRAPAETWPPEMPEITTELIRRFETLRAEKKAAQTPTFLHTCDWAGSIRTRRDPPRIEFARASWRTPDDKRRAFAQELRALAEFATPEKRSGLVASLLLDHLPWSDDAAEHAALIIDACDQVDWGYAVLLDALDARQSTELAGFMAKLDGVVPLGSMPWSELLRLLRLIREGFRVTAAQAARALRRFGRVPLGSGEQLFLHSVAELARLPLVDDARSHPLFRFFAECRPDFPPGTLADFNRWEEDAAKYLEIDLGAIRAAATRDTQERQRNLGLPPSPELEPAVLHIRIAPAQTSTDPATGVETRVHLVAAWLKGSWLQGQLATLFPERPLAPSEFPDTIRRLVSSARAQIEASVQPSRPLWIHLFLPLELIDQALDEVDVPRGRLHREKIGHRNPVLARSYDRFYVGDFEPIRADLRNRWPKGGQPLNPAAVSWHCSCPTDEALANGHFEAGKMAFVAFNLPATPAAPEAPTLLAYLQDSSLPFALILRAHAGKTEETRPRIEAGLLSKDPLTWPAQLPKIRAEAAQFHCSGFTLLWDDPNEVPPDVNYQFQVPQ